MTREPGILVVAVNQLPGEANRTGQGKGRALNAWLHPLFPPHEEAWSIASNYSTHPHLLNPTPSNPASVSEEGEAPAKTTIIQISLLTSDDRGENEKVTGNVAAAQTPIAPIPPP